MTLPLTTDPPPSRLADNNRDDGLIEDDDDDGDDVEDWGLSKRMSRLSMEGSEAGDADGELSDNDEDDGSPHDEEEEADDEVKSDANGHCTRQWRPAPVSLPGTPDRGVPVAAALSWSKEYASETEARWPGGGRAHGRRRGGSRRERMAREVWLERAWQMRKQRRLLHEGHEEVVVLVGKSGGSSPARGGGVAMDMEEMRACKDLGLDLPCDWTVEIPCCYGLSGVETASSGGNSPSGSWRISSPEADLPICEGSPADLNFEEVVPKPVEADLLCYEESPTNPNFEEIILEPAEDDTADADYSPEDADAPEF